MPHLWKCACAQPCIALFERLLTFRATVLEEPESLVLKLEGKIAGPWVGECKRAWLALEASRSTKRLALDLCGVTFVDSSGLALLGEIYSATRAELLADSPLTRHFADQAKRSAAD